VKVRCLAALERGPRGNDVTERESTMMAGRGESCRARERARKAGGAAGFTLAELLIALLLTGILMITVFEAMGSQRNSYVSAEQASDIGQNLRVAVESVTREVRLAGLRTVGGQPAVVQAAPFQLIFYADVNQSCLCGATGARVAEDQCWGYPTSLAPSVIADPPPSTCGLKTTNPMGDSPNGVSFYGTTVPADPANSPSHAELITWTFDRPANATTAGDASPGFSITSGSEALVSTDCSASKINGADLDPTLSASNRALPGTLDNPLYNLYRLVSLNRSSALSVDNSTSVAKVASGLRGPCKSDNSSDSAELVDEVGNIWPAFSYWIDITGPGNAPDGEINNNCDGTLSSDEDVLWGDTDFDCKFSAAEYAALTAVPNASLGAFPLNKEILANIVRVDVHLSGASQDRASLGTVTGGAAVNFRGKHLASSAVVRNRLK